MTYRFEALPEPLSRFGPLQATIVPQSIACRHVCTLDCFGRLTACAVQLSANVDSGWTCVRDRLDVRLVMITHDLIWDHAGALDRLPKECLGTGRVALAAYAGLDPTMFTSPNVARPICGPCFWRRTRAHLRNPDLNACLQPKLTEGKAYKAAVIATAHKLLARIYVVLKEGRPFEVR
jgi:hypothetical protein